MLIAAILFFASLAGIALLFALKHWEMGTERIIAPAVRSSADRHALRFKDMLEKGRGELEKLPPALVHVTRFGIHELALGIASLARILERQAHRLADMVSHKHRFERKETKNGYLKQVSDHQNSNDHPSDSERS